MRRFILCATLAGALAGCNSSDPGERALGGGLVGAGTGALVGGLATGRTGGALAGAAIGGAGGAILGAATTPRERVYEREVVYQRPRGYYGGRSCRGYDDFGNPVRVPC
jgi:hypothetical protein